MTVCASLIAASVPNLGLEFVKCHFKCTIDGCGLSFDSRYNLMGHLRKQTGERPYPGQEGAPELQDVQERLQFRFSDSSDASDHDFQINLPLSDVATGPRFFNPLQDPVIDLSTISDSGQYNSQSDEYPFTTRTSDESIFTRFFVRYHADTICLPTNKTTIGLKFILPNDCP